MTLEVLSKLNNSMTCTSKLISDVLVVGQFFCNPISLSSQFIIKLHLVMFIVKVSQKNISEPKNRTKKPSADIKENGHC